MRCTYVGDHIRHVNVFRDRPLALLDWAIQIHIFDLLAEACLRIDNFDQTIFDLNSDICAFFDVFNECTHGFDGKGLTAMVFVSSLLQ